jgi:hypothetical protein
MGDSAQKLQKIRESKEAIRLAIAAKGVSIPANTKLADYDDKISLIDDWVAPTDWIQLETPNDNEILLLASDINPHYAIKVEVVGGYIVDWGDGTINDWASGAIASHSYTVGDGQACSRGYTTFKIRIYAQVATNNITVYQTLVSPASFSGVSNGLLWAKFGTKDIGFNSLFGTRNNPLVYSFYLESVEMPQVMNTTVLYMFDTFKGCGALTKLKMPEQLGPNSRGSIDQTFYLTKIRHLDFSAIDTLVAGTGDIGNSYLKTFIPPKKLNFGPNGQGGYVFNGSDLGMMVLPNTDNNISKFINGYRGYGIKFNDSYENKIISLDSFFSGCSNLHDLTFVNTVKLVSGSVSSMMGACSSIKFFCFPTNTGVPITNINSAFIYCRSLETMDNFPALNSVTTMVGAFYMCNSLKNIDNLDQLGDETTGMDLVDTYAGCYSLNPVGGLKVRNKITGRFVLAGVNTSSTAALQSLLFTNQAAVSTWGGTSPQIDVSNCSMDATALDDLFESIIATSASFNGKTIRITGNPGASACTTSIITGAGGYIER